MIEQKSTPDPELLNQIAIEYEISKKFLGTAEEMSELEAEVDKSIPAIVLMSNGFDYDTILQKATAGNLVPHTDEFVLLLSVSKNQFLSKSSSLTCCDVRHYITNHYPRCSVMVLPDYGADGIICAIAKMAGRYSCSSRYGI